MRSNNRNSVISTGSAFLSICKTFAKYPYVLALAVPIFLLGSGCGKNTSPEDTTPPSKPVLYPAATFLSETDSVCGPYDQGSSAVNGIRITWLPAPDPDVAQWKIYFHKVNSLDAPFLAGVHSVQTSGTVFVVHDSRIQPDTQSDSTWMYEYWINAIDQAGNVSASSDKFLYRLLRRADGASVDTTGGVPTFHAQYSYSDQHNAPDRYCIKVRNSASRYIWTFAQNQYQSQLDVRFNDDGTVNQQYLTPDGRVLPGSYVVLIEFWQGDSAGAVASQTFIYP